jgi:peroxiredoxin
MKHKILFILMVASALLSGQAGFAAETNGVVTGLNALVVKVNAKIQQGGTTEKDFTDELKAFDVLYAKYKDLKSEDVAQILLMKTKLYLEVLNDPEKAAEVLQQIKSDLPETESGKRADEILASIKRPIEAERIRDTLVVGTKFPDFNEADLSGKPLSIANYKGKIVLIDFWATWCPVCIVELPEVLKTYGKYHDKGFEIIGVSLDEDQPTLERFTKEKDMLWPQYFDGKKWDNKLAVKYGVEAAPTTYLLDGNGKIIGKDLRGEELEAAVAKALAKN